MKKLEKWLCRYIFDVVIYMLFIPIHQRVTAFQLENERMITYEERLMESDLRRAQCYYIDYQHFVHLVRYRIHLMQKDISKSEDVELNRHFLLCPTCKTKYSELEYYKVRDKNNVFICPQCCPLQNFRTVASEKYYQLVEYDRTEKVNEVQLLAAKFKRQFRRSDGHDGIYDILAQLKDVPVSRNLPSENVARGNVTSRVVDSDIQNEIDYNHMALKVNIKSLHLAVTERCHIMYQTKKLTKRQIEHRKAISSTAGEFKVEFMDDKASSMTEWNGKRAPEEALHALGDEPAVKRPRELPEFLQGSRIREETTSRDIDGFGNKLTSVAKSDSKTEGELLWIVDATNFAEIVDLFLLFLDMHVLVQVMWAKKTKQNRQMPLRWRTMMICGKINFFRYKNVLDVCMMKCMMRNVNNYRNVHI